MRSANETLWLRSKGGLAEGAKLEVCYHDSMDGRHLGDEIRMKETMLWFPHRPKGERRVNVYANTIRALMRAGLIREQPPETITGSELSMAPEVPSAHS